MTKGNANIAGVDDAMLRRRLEGRRVAFLYLNFGPYHVARLRAIGNRLASLGATLVGVELAGQEEQYPWRVNRSSEPFEWATLFNDRPVERVSAREQRRAVRRKLAELDPAAVFVAGWSHPYLRAAARWCQRSRTPAIVCSDSPAIRLNKEGGGRRRYWIKEFYKRSLMKCFSAAFVSGDAARDYVVSLGVQPDRIFLRYDAVDDSLIARRTDAVRLACNYDDDGAFFLYPARIMELKNHLRLIAAYEKYALRCAGVPWRLVMIGSGPCERAVDEQISQSECSRIVRLPYLSFDELCDYYGRASALVFPSWAETWGLIVNEAAAAGLPLLVSTACPAGDHLVVEGENGWRFDPLNVDQLAETMGRLASMKIEQRRSFGERSRLIAAEWGIERHVDSALLALQKALESGETRSDGHGLRTN